jgi:hypothetical protein
MKFISIIFLIFFGFIGNAFAYGAGAIDSDQGSAWGYSYGLPTQDEANSKALDECGDGCHVVIRFNKACGAYAADQSSGSTAYGWAIATTKRAAQKNAIKYCEKNGGTDCIIRVWGCDL